jgi:membrane protease YdiL (CAAX protease family)
MHRTWLWLICGLVLVTVLDGAGNLCVMANLTGHLSTPMRALLLLGAVADAALAIWFYTAVIMRRWARRRAVEIVQRDWAANLGWGLLLGFVYILLLSGIIAALGGLRIDGFAAHWGLDQLLPILTLGVVAGTLEELLVRGILFNAVERWLGWVPAVVVSALVFGLLHGYNAFASVATVVGIVVSAGFYFGILMVWRRSLWLTIGFHAAWDMTLALTGVPIEQSDPVGALVIHTTGAPAVYGGQYGYEGSIPNIVIGFLALALFLLPRFRRWFAAHRSRRDDSLVAPVPVSQPVPVQ